MVSGTPVTLNGQGSKDPDPGDSITKYEWTQLGESSVVINNPTSSIAGFTAPPVTQSTTLQFQLEVQDTHQQSGFANAFVTVQPKPIPPTPNTPPIAVGSWKSLPSDIVPFPLPGKAFIKDKIELDGSGSFDRDIGDDVIKWEWKKKSPSDDYVPNTLTNPTSEKATFQLTDYIPMESRAFTFPIPMPIEFSLVVEDTHQTKSTNTEILTVNAECAPAMQNNAERY